MKIAREEIFGPVLSVLTFDDVDEVIEQANNNPYGLAAAVWTRDVKKAHTVSRRLKAGTVWINTYGLMDASLPFGGYKSSGFGRELGAHAMEHYTELKTVWLNMVCAGAEVIMPGKVAKIGTFSDWIGLFNDWRKDIGVNTRRYRCVSLRHALWRYRYG